MKQNKKPVVGWSRKSEKCIHVTTLDLECDLRTLVEELLGYLEEIEELGSQLASDPYIEYVEYEYHGIQNMRICYDKFAETEEECVKRVKAERQALKEWEDNYTKQRVLELEQDLKELKGGSE